MTSIDLTARARDYSLYLPSIQLAPARRASLGHAAVAGWPAWLAPHDFNYLDPANRFWTYGHALASAEVFRGKKNNAIAQRTGGGFLLGDSGGFQLGTGAVAAGKWKNFTEAEASRAWRASPMLCEITDWCEANCDGAMTLDLPLWARRTKMAGTPFHQCSVKRLIDLTIENLEYLEAREDKRCRYLNVLQGERPSEEDDWYDGVKRFHFDGWSLAGGVGVDGGPYRILRRLLILRDEKLLDPGFDWVHVLKLSQFPWAPMMTAIQRAVRKSVKNEKFIVTYDSSTPYSSGGKREEYFDAPQFKKEMSSWRNPPFKFPTLYCHAIGGTQATLGTVSCSGSSKCAVCANGRPHLPAPLTSPIASQLSLGEVVNNANMFATRRAASLFDAMLINHNVYTIVDGLIRANEAVFQPKPQAPQQLVDAVGLVEHDLFCAQDPFSMLDKNRAMLEQAVGFKARSGVL